MLTLIVGLGVITGAFVLGDCETQSSPGFLLNGSFAGRWVAQPHDGARRLGEPNVDRLEIVITKDLAFRKWTRHPDSLAWPDELLGRGFVRRNNGPEIPCSYGIAPSDHAFWIAFDETRNGAGVKIWLDASRCGGSVRVPSWDVLFVTDRRRTKRSFVPGIMSAPSARNAIIDCLPPRKARRDGLVGPTSTSGCDLL
jgi:hypothetical protein